MYERVHLAKSQPGRLYQCGGLLIFAKYTGCFNWWTDAVPELLSGNQNYRNVPVKTCLFQSPLLFQFLIFPLLASYLGHFGTFGTHFGTIFDPF